MSDAVLFTHCPACGQPVIVVSDAGTAWIENHIEIRTPPPYWTDDVATFETKVHTTRMCEGSGKAVDVTSSLLYSKHTQNPGSDPD